MWKLTLITLRLLVILVVFVFLRSAWATAIPSIAVPLSLVGTFGVMYLLRLFDRQPFADGAHHLHRLRRGRRHRRHREHHALSGAGLLRRRKPPCAVRAEIGFTVLSMSTSLIAVFIPILLMGGIVGRIFREFAVTLSVAVAISMVVSLTTTPTMCAKLLKTEKGRKHNWLYRRLARPASSGSTIGYASSLRWVLRHQPLVLGSHAGHRLPGDLSLHRGSQGLLPAAGHRAHQRQRPRQRGHLVSDHAGPKCSEYVAIMQDRSGRAHRLRLREVVEQPPTSTSR